MKKKRNTKISESAFSDNMQKLRKQRHQKVRITHLRNINIQKVPLLILRSFIHH